MYYYTGTCKGTTFNCTILSVHKMNHNFFFSFFGFERKEDLEFTMYMIININVIIKHNIKFWCAFIFTNTKNGIGTYSCAKLEVAWLYGGRKILGVYTSKPSNELRLTWSHWDTCLSERHCRISQLFLCPSMYEHFLLDCHNKEKNLTFNIFNKLSQLTMEHHNIQSQSCCKAFTISTKYLFFRQ